MGEKTSHGYKNKNKNKKKYSLKWYNIKKQYASFVLVFCIKVMKFYTVLFFSDPDFRDCNHMGHLNVIIQYAELQKQQCQ